MLGLCGCGGEEKSSFHPPDKFGPCRVGFRYLDFYDAARDRSAYTAVWYPALRPQSGAVKVMYLSAYEGRAYQDAPVDLSAAPYPLVMFSHGFQGIGIQSFTLCEHLASQGFIVAAPNHEGNTMNERNVHLTYCSGVGMPSCEVHFTTTQAAQAWADEWGIWFYSIEVVA